MASRTDRERYANSDLRRIVVEATNILDSGGTLYGQLFFFLRQPYFQKRR
jgi:hypothetical protein